MTTSDIPPSENQGGFGDFGKEKTFPCDNCGAKLTFSIGAQKLKCDHCGYEKQLTFADDAKVAEQDLMGALTSQATRRASAGQFTGTHEVKCNSCGATVAFSGSLTSSTCSYCGAPIERDKAHEAPNRLPVDGVCTFRVERHDAGVRLKKWVQSRWFAPGEFKSRGVNGKFDGVYMPFFTFDAMTFTRYTGERGDAYYVTVKQGDQEIEERRVRWSSASGSFQRFFDDVLIPALKSLPQSLLRSLEPWPLDEMIPFTDQALSGKLAHTYEIELKETFGFAKERMERALDGDCRERIGGDEQRVSSMDVNYSALTYKHVLLPVWILAYLYAGKSYRVVVNAMTGQVSGERPWSIPKIVAAVLFGAAVAAIIWYFTHRGGHPPPPPPATHHYRTR
jgi:hypothetical protein